MILLILQISLLIWFFGCIVSYKTENWTLVDGVGLKSAEFGDVMREVSEDLLRVVHAPEDQYAAVLFCGSGTLAMDVCVNSLLPKGKKLLVLDNGAYSSRAADIARAYSMDVIDA